MFYFLVQPPFRNSFIFLILLMPIYYWMDKIVEYLVSQITSISFYYSEPAHLKLIYLVLAVVFIGLTSAIHRSTNANIKAVNVNLLKWISTSFVGFLIGNIIHIWMLVNVLINKSSMMAFESSLMTYYLADYLLVFCFYIGAFLWIKPMIHEN